MVDNIDDDRFIDRLAKSQESNKSLEKSANKDFIKDDDKFNKD